MFTCFINILFLLLHKRKQKDMKITKTYTREKFKEFDDFFNVMIEWDVNSFESSGYSDHHYESDGWIYGYDYYGNEYTMSAQMSCGEVGYFDFDLIEKHLD